MQTNSHPVDSTPLVRDRVENFHGDQILYIGWDQHTMICAPIALRVPPDLQFGELLRTLLPDTAFALHPEWSRIQWEQVQWLANDAPFVPEPAATLEAQGLGHKAFLRMRTPGMTGIAGTGS